MRRIYCPLLGHRFTLSKVSHWLSLLPLALPCTDLRLHPAVGHQYLAGLWENNMNELLRRVKDPGKSYRIPNPPDAPAWPWATVSAAVWFPRRPFDRRQFETPMASSCQVKGTKASHEMSRTYRNSHFAILSKKLPAIGVGGDQLAQLFDPGTRSWRQSPEIDKGLSCIWHTIALYASHSYCTVNAITTYFSHQRGLPEP